MRSARISAPLQFPLKLEREFAIPREEAVVDGQSLADSLNRLHHRRSEQLDDAIGAEFFQLANRVVAVALVVATCASAIIDLVWVNSSMPTLGWALMAANSFYLARYLFSSARGQRVSWFQAHYPPNDELRLFDYDLEWIALAGGVLSTAMSIAVVCGVLPGS